MDSVDRFLARVDANLKEATKARERFRRDVIERRR